MRCVKSFLAGLLLISSVLVGVPSRAVGLSPMLTRSTAAEGEQSGDPTSEREQGRALLHRGKAADALVHLESALKGFQAAGDKSGEAATRDLMGELYERQGRYDIALQNYDAAYQIYAALAASEERQGALVASLSTQEGAYNANLMLSKIGEMQYRRGDTNAAREAFSRMRVTKPDTDKLRSAQNTKSNTESGAKKIFGLGGRLRGAASGRPSTSTPGDVTGVVADTADTLKQPFNSYRETIIYATYELGMGRIDYLNSRLDDAKTHFNNVLAATSGPLGVIGNLGQTRRYRAAARTSLGDVAFRQGRYADAVKLYADAAKGARDDARLDLMWPAQRGTGRSLWYQATEEKDQKKAAKMREDALASYRQALDTIETLREGSLRADEARATFLATTEEVFDEAAGALAEMALAAQSNTVPGASNTPATSAPLDGRALAYASEALSVVERGRSRSLLDLLNESGAEITEGVPADLLQKKRDIQNRQEEIAGQLTGVNLGVKPTKSVEQLEAELNQLQNDYDDVENQIRSASPRYAALTAPKPLTLEDIRQQVLDDQTALLEYKLGEERSYLFAVTRAGFTLSRLPARAEIEKQAVALREQIIPASERRSITAMVSDANAQAQRGLMVAGATAGSPAAVNAFAQASNVLYKSCVEPAAALFKQSRLLIVADGALNYVPFHALVTTAPAAGADFSTLPYLLKTNETLFAPSASVVAAIRQQRGASPQGTGMLIVADPVFDASDARARGAKPPTAQQPEGDAARGLSFDSAVEDVSESEPVSPGAAAETKRGVLVRLVGTRTEAQQIAKLADTSGQKADVWLDLQANESNVEGRDLRQYRFLHFATHGLLNTERPQFTGIVLSLVGNKPGTDGFLRTDEVFNLRLGSPLVMLSACETGLGKEKRGEGVMGLARAFMYAGAPAVGVSLWSVADKSTADLMADFYKSLLAGADKSPTAAMRTARLDMINGKHYSAPFYWAPFVLVGDWK
jgi:CHAT domain-containing protein